MNDVVKRISAERDLEEIFVFLGESDVDTALDFLFAAEQTFELLAKMPRLGHPSRFQSSRLQNLREYRVDGYEAYLIFYLPIVNGVEVVRVLHGKRDLDAIFDEQN